MLFSVLWGKRWEQGNKKIRTQKDKRGISTKLHIAFKCKWMSHWDATEWCKREKYEVEVPVSQLVLPVGVTGLTVNGKTPTPEPGDIVSRPVQRILWEHTQGYIWFKKHSSASHKNTLERSSAVGKHVDFSHFWGTHRAVSQETQPFHLQQKSSSAG